MRSMEVEFRSARAGPSFVRTWLVIVEFSVHFLHLIRLLDKRIAVSETVEWPSFLKKLPPDNF
jgi:hypothetical protein